MDVNSAEWSQRAFKDMSVFCVDKEEDSPVMCKRTGYACKDYMCPIVKAAKTIEEVRIIFKRQ